MDSDRFAPLANALKFNKTLTELDFEVNFLNDNGTRHLAEVLKMNNTLKKVELYRNEIGEEASAALASVKR
ncbi:unnamed protein product, partial [Adineta ricciae]